MTVQQHMQLEQRLVAILTSMGQTEKEVVETLVARHVLGQRNSSKGCVVARFLTQTLGALVQVSRAQARILDDRRIPRASCDLPPAVRNVVREFDYGLYPKLEEGIEVFVFTQEAG